MNDTPSSDTKQSDIGRIVEGDKVTVQLEGTVIDEMARHDGVIRLDVEGQSVEVLHGEIIDIDSSSRSDDIGGRDVGAGTNQGDQA